VGLDGPETVGFEAAEEVIELLYSSYE
jgi:hypothetical protein